MITTLNKIKEHTPCSEGWHNLLTFLNKTEADDEPLHLLTILESNGIEDAIWALCAVDGYEKEIRLMACDFADTVSHLMIDKRSTDAVDVSRRYANGEATEEELASAMAAAWDASWDAAWDAARAAARDAARAAAWDAARAAARDAARAAARDAAWAANTLIFKKYVS